jgi:hypothetical protein
MSFLKNFESNRGFEGGEGEELVSSDNSLKLIDPHKDQVDLDNGDDF